jgi:tetratricopeptide (TPR) repeat protein
MTDQLLERAQLLMETKRYLEAEKQIMQALIEDPNNGHSLALLAWCRLLMDKKSEALQPAREAVAAQPDNPHFLYILGYCYFLNNYQKEAREAAYSALKLDPTDPDLYRLMADLEFHEKQWDFALNNAEKGLEFDPENQELINLRAMCLVKLNRTSEASETVDYALYEDPENSYSHANKGWVQVEQGKYKEAQVSFLEALRLNPDNDHARNGLKEAIKAKNWLYRGVLRYFLWMQKLSEKSQWLVVIGAYIGIKFVRGIADASPMLKPFLMPIIVAYVVFVYSSWIARPLSNLFLRLHPLGKNALDHDEKTASNWVGVLVTLAILAGLGGTFLPSEMLTLAALILGALLIPVGGIFTARPGRKARKILTAYALFLAFCGLVLPILSEFFILQDLFDTSIMIFAIGIFAYGWVANYVIMNDFKQF